jgi:hypothetical protein
MFNDVHLGKVLILLGYPMIPDPGEDRGINATLLRVVAYGTEICPTPGVRDFEIAYVSR